MATCAAVTMLLPTRSSVLYLTGAAETTPVSAGGLKQEQYVCNAAIDGNTGRMLCFPQSLLVPTSVD